MSETSLMKVGAVGVDSGRIMLLDPCNEGKRTSDVECEYLPGVRIVLRDEIPLGVIVATPGGDGVFPVIAEIVDGKLNGILLDFGDEDLEKGILGARMIARGEEAPEIIEREITHVPPEAWKGTPPAQGTRRALIRDTIERTFAGKVFPTNFDAFNELYLDLADAVEEALIRVVDQGATPESGSPASTAMDVLDQLEISRTREGAILDIGQRVMELSDKFVQGRRHLAQCYRLTGADPSDGSDAILACEALDEVRLFRAEYDELEEAIAKVGEALDRIDAPQGATYAERIDRLYRELTGRALGYGQPRTEGKVPAGARELCIVLDHGTPASLMHSGPKFVELETGDGVSVGGFESRWEPGTTIQRIVVPYGRDDAWVSEVAYQAAGAASGVFLREDGEKVMPAAQVRDAVAELLKDFGIPQACRDCATEQFEHGAKEVDGRRDDTIEALSERCDQLLEQRESARVGEDHFKAQRDSALHLVRWLIGDIIPPDLIRFRADDEEARS